MQHKTCFNQITILNCVSLSVSHKLFWASQRAFYPGREPKSSCACVLRQYFVTFFNNRVVTVVDAVFCGTEMPTERTPQYYCAGTNGRNVICQTLDAIGWERRSKEELVAAKEKTQWNR